MIGVAIPAEIGRDALLQPIGPRTPTTPGQFGGNLMTQGETFFNGPWNTDAKGCAEGHLSFPASPQTEN